MNNKEVAVAEPKVLTAEELLKLAREIVDPRDGHYCIRGNHCRGCRAISVAQALIERLEPVSPTPCNDWRMSQKCGACKRLLYANGGSNPNFCPNCGRKIQWT